MKDYLIINSDSFESTVKKCVIECLHEFEKQRKLNAGEKLYTINQVRKKLGKSHCTVKKYVESGILRTTSNGLIPEGAIEDFLQKQ